MLGVDCEGMCGEYLPEKLKVGKYIGLLETESFTSHDDG